MNKPEAYMNILRLNRKTRRYATHDPEVALVLARKTTESICKFLYADRISSVPNSMMLDKLLDELTNNRMVPRKIIAPMRAVQLYGNYGGHDQVEEYGEIDNEYARPCINALNTIIKWFRSEYYVLDGALQMEVCHAGFSKRILRILNNINIIHIVELAAKTESELLKYRKVSKKVLAEMKDVLTQHGLSLSLKVDPGFVAIMSNKALQATRKPRRITRSRALT